MHQRGVCKEEVERYGVGGEKSLTKVETKRGKKRRESEEKRAQEPVKRLVRVWETENQSPTDGFLTGSHVEPAAG